MEDMTTSSFPPPPSPSAPTPIRRLERDPDGMLGGVASGVAAHLNLDVSLVRLFFILVSLTTGIGLIAYLAAWIIVPVAHHPLNPRRPVHPTSSPPTAA